MVLMLLFIANLTISTAGAVDYDQFCGLASIVFDKGSPIFVLISPPFVSKFLA